MDADGCINSRMGLGQSDGRLASGQINPGHKHSPHALCGRALDDNIDLAFERRQNQMAMGIHQRGLTVTHWMPTIFRPSWRIGPTRSAWVVSQ
jgi:hypothetical protein